MKPRTKVRKPVATFTASGTIATKFLPNDTTPSVGIIVIGLRSLGMASVFVGERMSPMVKELSIGRDVVFQMNVREVVRRPEDDHATIRGTLEKIFF